MHTNCEEIFSSEAKKEKTPYRRIKREEFRWYKNERNGKKTRVPASTSSNSRVHKFQSVVLFFDCALSLWFLSFPLSSFFFSLFLYIHFHFFTSSIRWFLFRLSRLPLIIQHSTGLYILNKCVRLIFSFFSAVCRMA